MNLDSRLLSDLFRRYSPGTVTDYQRLYLTDSLVRRIIDLYPESAYSTGFIIRGPQGKIYERALNSLGTWETFKRASIWARLNGLAAILILTTGTRLDTPISGTVTGLAIYPLSGDTDLTKETVIIGTDEVHKSRLLLFTGSEVLTDFGYLKVSYRPVLDGVIEVIQEFRKIPAVALKLMRTSNQVSIGTAGLSASLRSDIMSRTTTAQQQILSRLDSINAGRDISEVILYDKDNETISNTALSLSGVGDLCDILENQLAMRTDYPKTILFNRNDVSNLGSGSNAQLVTRMEWATKLATWIDTHWTAHVEKLCDLLGRSLGLGSFDVHVPLSLILSPDEQATINKAQAETLRIIHGIYPMGSNEIREYAENNMTNLMLPELASLEQAVQPPTPDPPQMDALSDNLTFLANINSAVVDVVMEKIANG